MDGTAHPEGNAPWSWSWEGSDRVPDSSRSCCSYLLLHYLVCCPPPALPLGSPPFLNVRHFADLAAWSTCPELACVWFQVPADPGRSLLVLLSHPSHSQSARQRCTEMNLFAVCPLREFPWLRCSQNGPSAAPSPGAVLHISSRRVTLSERGRP